MWLQPEASSLVQGQQQLSLLEPLRTGISIYDQITPLMDSELEVLYQGFRFLKSGRDSRCIYGLWFDLALADSTGYTWVWDQTKPARLH